MLSSSILGLRLQLSACLKPKFLSTVNFFNFFNFFFFNFKLFLNL